MKASPARPSENTLIKLDQIATKAWAQFVTRPPQLYGAFNDNDAHQAKKSFTELAEALHISTRNLEPSRINAYAYNQLFDWFNYATSLIEKSQQTSQSKSPVGDIAINFASVAQLITQKLNQILKGIGRGTDYRADGITTLSRQVAERLATLEELLKQLRQAYQPQR